MNEPQNQSTICWNDIWVSIQEMGKVMSQVDGPNAPAWAIRLLDALDDAETAVLEICEKEENEGLSGTSNAE